MNWEALANRGCGWYVRLFDFSIRFRYATRYLSRSIDDSTMFETFLGWIHDLTCRRREIADFGIPETCAVLIRRQCYGGARCLESEWKVSEQCRRTRDFQLPECGVPSVIQKIQQGVPSFSSKSNITEFLVTIFIRYGHFIDICHSQITSQFPALQKYSFNVAILHFDLIYFHRNSKLRV